MSDGFNQDRDSAIVDTQYYVTDPDVQHVPVEELLSRVRLLSSGYAGGLHVLKCCRTISRLEQLSLTLRRPIPG